MSPMQNYTIVVSNFDIIIITVYLMELNKQPSVLFVNVCVCVCVCVCVFESEKMMVRWALSTDHPTY